MEDSRFSCILTNTCRNYKDNVYFSYDRDIPQPHHLRLNIILASSSWFVDNVLNLPEFNSRMNPTRTLATYYDCVQFDQYTCVDPTELDCD